MHGVIHNSVLQKLLRIPATPLKFSKSSLARQKNCAASYAQGNFLCMEKCEILGWRFFKPSRKNIRTSNCIIFLDSFGMKTPPKKIVEFNHQPQLEGKILGMKHSSTNLFISVFGETPSEGRVAPPPLPSGASPDQNSRVFCSFGSHPLGMQKKILRIFQGFPGSKLLNINGEQLQSAIPHALLP